VCVQLQTPAERNDDRTVDSTGSNSWFPTSTIDQEQATPHRVRNEAHSVITWFTFLIMPQTNLDLPFHVLMATNNPQQEWLKDKRLQADYISRRFHAENPQGNKLQEDLWTAVTPIEKTLVEYCELEDEEDEESFVVQGALVMKKAMQFVELMARHCYRVRLRVLVLTILERTVQQDNIIMQHEKEIVQENAPDEEEKQAEFRSKHTSTSRFMEAGGLKILNQWLYDAITPVKAAPANPPLDKKQRTSSSTASLRVSPSGPLLLPILRILKGIPFNKSLIKESQLNVTLRDLEESLSGLEKESAHPCAGGYSVGKTIYEIESVMSAWKESSKDKNRPVAEDVLRDVHEILKEPLALLKDFDAGKAGKPDFLEQFEQNERQAKERKEFSKMTPEERERKQLLDEIMRKREEAEEKMKELKKKQEPKQLKKPKKTVSWRDGQVEGKAIIQIMIEVHEYPPEADIDDDFNNGGQNYPSGEMNDHAEDDDEELFS
jgi:hypothetical protein